MPPIIGPVGGGAAGGPQALPEGLQEKAGDVATAPWRTGLPLNLLGSVGAAGAAAATGAGADFAPCIDLIFALSSAFSLSILSRRAITSSSVADRAVPPNAIRQSVAQAVPHRSLLFITWSPPRFDSTFRSGDARGCHIPIGRLGGLVNEITVICYKNGTWIPLRRPICRNFRGAEFQSAHGVS